jgi:hypothetical protein
MTEPTETTTEAVTSVEQIEVGDEVSVSGASFLPKSNLTVDKVGVDYGDYDGTVVEASLDRANARSYSFLITDGGFVKSTDSGGRFTTGVDMRVVRDVEPDVEGDFADNGELAFDVGDVARGDTIEVEHMSTRAKGNRKTIRGTVTSVKYNYANGELFEVTFDTGDETSDGEPVGIHRFGVPAHGSPVISTRGPKGQMSRLGRVLRADVYHADEDDRDHMVRDDLRDSAADVFEAFVDSDEDHDTPRGESETDSPEAATDGGESPEPGEPFRIDFRAYSGGNAAVQPYYTVPAEVFIHYFEDTDEHVILVTQGWFDDHEDDDGARSSEWARYHIDGTTVDPDDVFAHDRIDRPTATDGGVDYRDDRFDGGPDAAGGDVDKCAFCGRYAPAPYDHAPDCSRYEPITTEPDATDTLTLRAPNNPRMAHPTADGAKTVFDATTMDSEGIAANVYAAEVGDSATVWADDNGTVFEGEVVGVDHYRSHGGTHVVAVDVGPAPTDKVDVVASRERYERDGKMPTVSTKVIDHVTGSQRPASRFETNR